MNEEKVTAQISHLIKILVDNLQTDPFAPVREYISNAHDAIKGQKNPCIQVWAEQGKLNIRDNGSGMTRKVILEAYTRIAGHFSRIDEKETIGMFGIGVLSAFIAADKLVVETRHADDPHGWRLEWKRYAETFHLEPIEKHDIGTLAILHLHEDARQDIGNDKTLREYVRKTFGLFTTPICVGRDMSFGAVNQQWQWLENLFAGEKKLLNNDETRRLIGQYFPQQKLLCAYFGKGPDGARVLLGIPQDESTFTADRDKIQFFSKGVRLMGNIRDFFPANLSFVVGLIDSPNLKIQISREEIFIQDDHFQGLKRTIEAHILRFFDMLAKEQPAIVEQALHIHKTKLIAHGKECDDLCGLFRDYYHFTTTNGLLRWREILPFAEKDGDERFIYYTSNEINAIDLLHGGNKFLSVFALGPEQMVLKQISDCECIELRDVATIFEEDKVDVPESFRHFLNLIVPYLGKRGIRTAIFINRQGEKQTPAMFRIINGDGVRKFADGGGGLDGQTYSVDALMLNIANPIVGKLAIQQSLERRQLEKIADTFYQIAVLHSPFNDLKFSTSESIVENLVDCLELRIGTVSHRYESNGVLTVSTNNK
jgi:HSP90 family molecular chaperone